MATPTESALGFGPLFSALVGAFHRPVELVSTDTGFRVSSPSPQRDTACRQCHPVTTPHRIVCRKVVWMCSGAADNATAAIPLLSQRVSAILVQFSISASLERFRQREARAAADRGFASFGRFLPVLQFACPCIQRAHTIWLSPPDVQLATDIMVLGPKPGSRWFGELSLCLCRTGTEPFQSTGERLVYICRRRQCIYDCCFVFRSLVAVA